MNIEAEWSDPIRLRKGPTSRGLFNQIDLNLLPPAPGVYVFARKYGKKLIPIYIGQTFSIRHRVKSHLNSLALMTAVQKTANGARVLIYCTIKPMTRDKAKKHIKIIENALILHAQSEGHELFNKMGMKLPTDAITFSGCRISQTIAPKVMLIKQALSRR